MSHQTEHSTEYQNFPFRPARPERFRYGWEVTGVQNLRKKTILALALMLLLTLAGSFLLVRNGIRLVEEREENRTVRKLNAADNLIPVIVESVGLVSDSSESSERKNVAVMTAALRRYLADGAYTGPVCFRDGLVFRVKDGEPVFPDTVPEGFVGFDAAVLERALSNPGRSGGLIRKADGLSEEELTNLVSSDPLEALRHHYSVRIDEIGDGWYYASLSEAGEYFDSTNSLSYSDELVAAVEDAFGGALLILSTADSRLPLLFDSSRFPETHYAEDLGLTAEDIRDQKKTLTIDGQQWNCTYRSSETAKNRVTIFASPQGSGRAETAMELLPVTLLMLLFLSTMTVYVVSAQTYVRDRILNEDMASRYRPVSLRVRCAALGAVGALIVFCAAGLLQAVSILHSETLAGSETIRTLYANLRDLEAEKTEAIREKQEAWYLGYAERIAGLIAQDPSLAEESLLQEFCDILQVDYIITFDQRGRESSCSRGYRDFTLNTGKGDCWDDFGRLLMGVPSIIRDTETDARTGLERQMIGVCLPVEGSDQYGALVMALYPDTIGVRENSFGTFELISSLTMEGSTTLLADAETGTILHASNPALVGNGITEYGLPSDSLRDGYMDFSLIFGAQSYIVTVKSGDTVIYSITETAVLFRNCLSYALLAALVFFSIFGILYAVLMFGYTEHELAVYSRVGTPLKDEAASTYFGRPAAGKASNRAGYRGVDLSSWRALDPEGKAVSFFRVLFCLLILLYLMIRAGRNGDHFSLIRYILQGDWMRGINLFSLCAVGILIIAVYVFLTLCRCVVRLLCRALDSKGETVCRLAYNLIQYLTIFVLIYQTFSYLGFPTSTVLASVGIAALAVTFGAQTLIADILAGVFNVLEGGYRVGDYIKIDGFEGFVRSIGVRTTKVESRSRDIEIIENSQIGNVVNMTPLDSVIKLELVIPYTESLERIEAILRAELPEIGSRMKEIVEGPTYLGVSEICTGKMVPHEPSMTLLIVTGCKVENYPDVERYVNREVMLLCQRENIRLL